MTVSYSGDVANSSSFGCFSKILCKWRGSIYKLIYKELLAYIMAYFVINLTYRVVLVPKSECDMSLPSCQRWKSYRELFESLRLYCNENLKSVPLTFLLGFYVSLIVSRWWKQYTLLPWPDSFGLLVTGLYNTGKDFNGRILKRTIIRYITLSYCIALRTVSFRLKKRFPTLEHLVDAGIMREDELEEFRKLDEKVSANKWFLPLVWVSKMIGSGLQDGFILAPTAGALMMEVGKIRQNLQTLLSYDWLCVPLVYTQTVTLATYFYFAAALIGSQWVVPATDEAYEKVYKTPAGNFLKLDLVFPIFVLIQFCFFLGWLKVAETLINPFGEDDDDFELNRLIDRHMQVGFLICDPTVAKPDLLKDKFWNEGIPTDIPYTVGSEIYKGEEFKGSAEISLDVKDSESIYSDGTIHYGQASLRKRFGSRETIYESIRTIGEKKKGRLLDQVLKRNFSAQHRVRSEHKEMYSYQVASFEHQGLKSSKVGQISETEVKEAYGLR